MLPDPYDLQTPASWPREVTPINVSELRHLRLKAELREEMDDRFDRMEERVDVRFDKIETKQDEQFSTLLRHVTRKSVMETLVANTKVMAIMALILLVLAVGYTQSDLTFALPGVDVEVHAPLEN